MKEAGVRALLFDVFGTVVDWRTGVAREAKRILNPLGFEIDWLAFADEWRAGYQPSVEEVRKGKIPYVRLDVLHRGVLDRIKGKYGLDGLDEDTLADLNLAWHRLDAWDDVKRTFPKLRQRFLMAPLSNGNIAIMVDIARRNAIGWDAVLGAEIAADYKPKPRVYLSAAEAFGLGPAQCMLVAAHSYDLQAARQLGFMTAHVARPEEAPGMESGPTTAVDIAVKSFDELVGKLA